MRFVAILVLAFVFVDADHHLHEGHDHYVVKTSEDLLSYRNKCVEELDVPKDLVELYKKWEYPDNEKTHCYMKCIFEQFGLFDEQQGFNINNIHHQLSGDDADHTDETHKKIADCADNNSQGSSSCDEIKSNRRAGSCHHERRTTYS